MAELGIGREPVGGSPVCTGGKSEQSRKLAARKIIQKLGFSAKFKAEGSAGLLLLSKDDRPGEALNILAPHMSSDLEAIRKKNLGVWLNEVSNLSSELFYKLASLTPDLRAKFAQQQKKVREARKRAADAEAKLLALEQRFEREKVELQSVAEASTTEAFITFTRDSLLHANGIAKLFHAKGKRGEAFSPPYPNILPAPSSSGAPGSTTSAGPSHD